MKTVCLYFEIHQNNRYFSDSYDLKAEGTRYSKEFAAFLKGVYGDDPYDLPFA